MRRRALVVAGAAGSSETLAGVLQRFNFAAAEEASDLESAFERLRSDHFDVVILPLQDVGAVQMATLEREIRRVPATFFVGTAPEPNPELLLRAMRGGVHEFLIYPPDANELASAIDRLVRRGHSEQQQGQVYAVYSAKGGLGNTTVAVNLAYALARNHPELRVALADFVIAGGDVRLMLNLRPDYDLGSLIEKLDRVDAELLFSILTPYSGAVWTLPSPDSPEYEDTVDAGTVSGILDHLRAHFAHTVVDCEHHMSERTLAVFDAADRILLTTQLTVQALNSAQRTIALCHRLGYPDEKLCVIVNRYQSGEVLSTSDASSVLKRDVFWKLPNDYRTATAALTKGVPIAEYDADSKLAASFGQLAHKVGGGAPGGLNGRNGPGASRLRRLFGMSKRS